MTQALILKRSAWMVGVLAVCVCALQLGMQNAWAASSCTDSNLFGNVYAGGAGQGGDLVQTATSPTGSVVAIFSMVLQFFQQQVGGIMSGMYCSFQSLLVGPLGIATTLLVIVFGIMLATGMSPLTYKEASVILFKISLIWAFAANADWGIGIGYRFFMGVAEEGSDIVLSAICGSNTPSLTTPDSLFGSLFMFIAGGGGALITPPEGCLGMTGPNIGVPDPACTSFFMVALASMVAMSPSILSFAGIMVIEYLTLYVRALVGYLAALVFISFLFILSPLFISFALFKSTFHLFSKWTQYLVSFSLQMILIFAFLAMITAVSGQLIGTFFQFLSLFKPYDVTWGAFDSHMPMTVCSICDYSLGGASGGASASAGMPGITCGGGSSSNSSSDVTGTDGSKIIPLTSLYLHQDLVAFIVAQTVAWWLVAYVLGEFMQKAPEYARRLAGAPMSGALGGTPLPSFASALSGAAKGAVDKFAHSSAGQAAAAGLGAMGLKGMNDTAKKRLETGKSTLPRAALGGSGTAAPVNESGGGVAPAKAAPAKGGGGGSKLLTPAKALFTQETPVPSIIITQAAQLRSRAASADTALYRAQRSLKPEVYASLRGQMSSVYKDLTTVGSEEGLNRIAMALKAIEESIDV